MTRARAAWLAAAVVLLVVVGYVVRLRRRPVPALPVASPTLVRAAPARGMAEDEALEPLMSSEEEPTVPSQLAEIEEQREQPLATWARVAIVVVALLAFFAVSLIATKQV